MASSSCGRGSGWIDIESRDCSISLELGAGRCWPSTVVLSFMAGLAPFAAALAALRRRLYTAIGSLIMPSIVVSLGIALEFRIIDDSIKALGDTLRHRLDSEDDYFDRAPHVHLRAW